MEWLSYRYCLIKTVIEAKEVYIVYFFVANNPDVVDKLEGLVAFWSKDIEQVLAESEQVGSILLCFFSPYIEWFKLSKLQGLTTLTNPVSGQSQNCSRNLEISAGIGTLGNFSTQ